MSFLQKVPQDVKSLLAFLLVTCGSLLEASSQLSSPMSSRDFEDGCKRLGFTRFQGQGEIQRFLAVFRYIDSKGEGRIGSKEFARLQDLEQEGSTCIHAILLHICNISNMLYIMSLV